MLFRTWNSMEETIVLSSKTVPQLIQIDCPVDSWKSISREPQLEHFIAVSVDIIYGPITGFEIDWAVSSQKTGEDGKLDYYFTLGWRTFWSSVSLFRFRFRFRFSGCELRHWRAKESLPFTSLLASCENNPLVKHCRTSEGDNSLNLCSVE